MKRRGAWLFLAITLWACGQPYVMVGGPETEISENFAVDLPDGWRRHNLDRDKSPRSKGELDQLIERRELTWDTIRITRDGLLLQQIGIGRIASNNEFPHTKKKLSEGMLPQEAAEVIIDNLRSNPDITKQQIAENVPAKVGSYPGFKLMYTYQTKRGLTIKGAYYGVMLGKWHYYLLYEAPARYYFAKDLPVFEKVKESFKILTTGLA